MAKHNPYKSGTKTATGRSLLPEKPEYLSNKCLVISGIDKSITQEMFKLYVNEQVGEEIDFRSITCLSREGSSWLTVAIELSEKDYGLLSDASIWEPKIRLRPFKGFLKAS